MVELLGPVNPPPAVTKFVAENDGPVKPAEVAIEPLALSVVTPDRAPPMPRVVTPDIAPLFSVTPDTLLDDVESVLIDGPVKPAEVAIELLALSVVTPDRAPPIPRVVTPDTAPLFSVTPDTLLNVVEFVLIDGPVKPAEVAIAPLALSVVTPDRAPLFRVAPPA